MLYQKLYLVDSDKSLQFSHFQYEICIDTFHKLLNMK